MFALLAVVAFAVWFVLDLVRVSVDPVNLLALGLTFLALHHLPATGPPWRR